MVRLHERGDYSFANRKAVKVEESRIGNPRSVTSEASSVAVGEIDHGPFGHERVDGGVAREGVGLHGC